MVERIFWLISFTIGLFAAGFLITDVYSKYRKNPVIVAFAPEELRISRIPFPAITICNVNRVLKRVVLAIQKNSTSSDNATRVVAENELAGINSICTSKTSVAQMINGTKRKSNSTNQHQNHDSSKIIEIMHKVSQPCGEMIGHCFLGSVDVPCAQVFDSILTESGICCTINMMPQSLLLKFPKTFEYDHDGKQVSPNAKNVNKLWADWGFEAGYVSEESFYDGKRPLRQFKPGKSNGLSLLLFPDLDNYYCGSGDSLGFKVVAHSPLEFPHPFEFGTAVPPEAEVHASVIPDITMADNDDIFDVKIDSRQCYKMNEFPLKYFKTYTDANCIDECTSNYTLDACGCVQFYQPHDHLTRLCGESDRKCLKTLAERTAMGILFCSKCYPLCKELDFRLESSQSVLKNSSQLWSAQGDKNLNERPWFSKPVTILNVFYGTRTVVPKVRKKLFESTDLIASTGGLLGLCLGFSGLSAVELIYFCTMRPWFQKKRFRRAIRLIADTFVNSIKNIMERNRLNKTVSE